MYKKVINWVEIKGRFLAGERPSDIAADYKNCTAQQISQKASYGKWVSERNKINKSVTSEVEENVKAVLREKAVQISTTLRENAYTASEIEKELLDTQLLIIRRGRAFIDYLDDIIIKHALFGSDDPLEQQAVIKELRSTYKAIFDKMLPSKLVVSAFQSARVEADLVADEEHEKATGEDKRKSKGMQFVLNFQQQKDVVLPEQEDTD